jgi:hypothetical protein
VVDWQGKIGVLGKGMEYGNIAWRGVNFGRKLKKH